MRTFIVEVSAKLVVRSNTDPEKLPADIYAQVSEFIPNDEDIIDLEVNSFLLPNAASH